MQPMCLTTTGAFAGWAIGVGDCDGDVTLEYFDEDGVSQGGSLPANWKPCVQGEDGPVWTPGQSALTFASPTSIDFSGDWYRTLNVNGNLTFAGASYQTGTEITVLVTETGGSSRTIAYPAGWVWLTTKPTSIAANKKILYSFISFGTAEANVIARAWVQS